MQSLDSLRDEVRRSSGGGFAFLLANALGWLVAGTVGLGLGPTAGAWALMFQGGLTVPLAFALERSCGFPPLRRGHPLLPLVLQLALTQIVALPALIVVLRVSPDHLPMAFAAVVGGHFLPYAWLQRTRTYVVLAVVVGLAPWLAILAAGRVVLPWIPFGVAATLAAGAFRLRLETRAGVPAAAAVA